jgi:hypothetical protein
LTRLRQNALAPLLAGRSANRAFSLGGLGGGSSLCCCGGGPSCTCVPCGTGGNPGLPMQFVSPGTDLSNCPNLTLTITGVTGGSGLNLSGVYTLFGSIATIPPQCHSDCTWTGDSGPGGSTAFGCNTGCGAGLGFFLVFTCLTPSDWDPGFTCNPVFLSFTCTPAFSSLYVNFGVRTAVLTS